MDPEVHHDEHRDTAEGDTAHLNGGNEPRYSQTKARLLSAKNRPVNASGVASGAVPPPTSPTQFDEALQYPVAPLFYSFTDAREWLSRHWAFKECPQSESRGSEQSWSGSSSRSRAMVPFAFVTAATEALENIRQEGTPSNIVRFRCALHRTTGCKWGVKLVRNDIKRVIRMQSVRELHAPTCESHLATAFALANKYEKARLQNARYFTAHWERQKPTNGIFDLRAAGRSRQGQSRRSGNSGEGARAPRSPKRRRLVPQDSSLGDSVSAEAGPSAGPHSKESAGQGASAIRPASPRPEADGSNEASTDSKLPPLLRGPPPRPEADGSCEASTDSKLPPLLRGPPPRPEADGSNEASTDSKLPPLLRGPPPCPEADGPNTSSTDSRMPPLLKASPPRPGFSPAAMTAQSTATSTARRVAEPLTAQINLPRSLFDLKPLWLRARRTLASRRPDAPLFDPDGEYRFMELISTKLHGRHPELHHADHLRATHEGSRDACDATTWLPCCALCGDAASNRGHPRWALHANICVRPAWMLPLRDFSEGLEMLSALAGSSIWFIVDFASAARWDHTIGVDVLSMRRSLSSGPDAPSASGSDETISNDVCFKHSWSAIGTFTLTVSSSRYERSAGPHPTSLVSEWDRLDHDACRQEHVDVYSFHATASESVFRWHRKPGIEDSKAHYHTGVSIAPDFLTPPQRHGAEALPRV